MSDAAADVDRLAELQTSDGDTPQPAGTGAAPDTEEKAETNPELQEHMRLYDPIKKGLHLIQENVEKINRLKQKDRQTANEKARKEIMQELDAIMGETTGTGAQIKKFLEEIKKQNVVYEKEHKNSAKAEVRKNLYQTNIRRFHQIMNEYNAASHEFKQALQERTRRQLKIVDSKISDEEIEKIVDSGQANDVIKQALLSDNLQSVVRDIEERHLDILKLERQVLEVYELFRDLATLVDLQQETLDVIENRIQKSTQYVKDAEKELVKAADYQDKARQRKCCCLIIALGILVAILVPVIIVAQKDS
jgi:t-SNARE complex subunit (syntaxin)